MTPDTDTTLSALRQAVAAFVDARDWRPFHTPKNLTMSIAIEAAELMERFQWLTAQEAMDAARDPVERQAIAEELADVMIYCLSLGNALGIDISSAVFGKLSVNEGRYPADRFERRHRKPQRER